MSIYSNTSLDKQQIIQIYHYDNNNHLPRQNEIHAAINMQIITRAKLSKSTAAQCIIIFKSCNGSFRKYS